MEENGSLSGKKHLWLGWSLRQKKGNGINLALSQIVKKPVGQRGVSVVG
jgi:hypothetical protein